MKTFAKILSILLLFSILAGCNATTTPTTTQILEPTATPAPVVEGTEGFPW